MKGLYKGQCLGIARITHPVNTDPGHVGEAGNDFFLQDTHVVQRVLALVTCCACSNRILVDVQLVATLWEWLVRRISIGESFFPSQLFLQENPYVDTERWWI